MGAALTFAEIAGIVCIGPVPQVEFRAFRGTGASGPEQHYSRWKEDNEDVFCQTSRGSPRLVRG
jgi:hypothetical protein